MGCLRSCGAAVAKARLISRVLPSLKRLLQTGGAFDAPLLEPGAQKVASVAASIDMA